MIELIFYRIFHYNTYNFFLNSEFVILKFVLVKTVKPPCLDAIQSTYYYFSFLYHVYLNVLAFIIDVSA